MKKYAGPRDTTPPSSEPETWTQLIERVGSDLWTKANAAASKEQEEDRKALAKPSGEAEAKTKAKAKDMIREKP